MVEWAVHNIAAVLVLCAAAFGGIQLYFKIQDWDAEFKHKRWSDEQWW